MVVKIELHKAYDIVDWDFLEVALGKFGFPKSLSDLVLYCIENSNISILWNGEKLPHFKPKRGLRQGGPLAPYLFNIIMECLSWDIQNKVERGTWKPVSLNRGGVGVSHLFFFFFLQMI